MIAREVARLFKEHVTPTLLKSAESGEWPTALWRQVYQMGLSDVLLLEPEDAPWQQCHDILKEAGRFAVPLPLSENMLAHFCIHDYGDGNIPEGPATIMTLEQSRSLQHAGNIILHGEGDQQTVSGEWRQVAAARHCRWAVIEVPLNDLAFPAPALLYLDSEAVSIIPHTAISGESHDTVRVERAPVLLLLQGDTSAARLQGRMAWMRACQMAGAIEALLEATVDYANMRQQFGKPIGRFQAIQHALAELAGESACASMAAASAVPILRESDTFEIACAKIRAGEAAGRATAIAHQVHGAIGFTREHTLHYLTRRLWTWRAEYGDETRWATELGKQAITAANMTDGLWAWMTARQATATPSPLTKQTPPGST